MIIKPKYGVNLRLEPYDLVDQWAYMQNVDMTHDELYTQIPGSVKYHGSVLGTNAPTAIIPSYNNENNTAEVLTAVDDKILKRVEGQNEFETLKDELTPNSIMFFQGVENKTYIGSISDGLLEYDGISQVEIIDEIKLKDIYLSKETNRAFGITVNNEIVWTDDLSTIQGAPVQWNPLNLTKIHPTKGDVPVKLWVLEGRLVILMGNSIWIYYINGSPAAWRPEKAPTVVGCSSPKTVRQIGGELWFLGFSPDTGIGIYAFNGRTSRLLSYDVEPLMKRINPFKVSDSAAVLVDNTYKISFALDSDIENNTTLHLDTINYNRETNTPNIYGPHTYGFNCSAVLDTRKFRGGHLFGRKHSDGARVFRVADYQTQYSDEHQDNGDLIASVLISPVYDKVVAGKNVYDQTWQKKFKNIYSDFKQSGTHSAQVQILKGYENEVHKSFSRYLEGGNNPFDIFNLGSTPVESKSLDIDNHLERIVSDAIQFKISNTFVNTRLALRCINFEATPFRRKKYVQKIPA